MSSVHDLHELPECDWPHALHHEVRRIRRWPHIKDNSVSVVTDGLKRLRIGFTIETERLLEARSSPIQDWEPIRLVYHSVESVGLIAPFVWSARADFPRDIGHVNPTRLDQPVSLCLARAGLQPVYDRYGADGIVDRLVDWLHDAKTGQLMKDGWEPVPMGEGQAARGGYFDISYLQELALKYGAGIDWKCGMARLLADGVGGKVVFLTPALNLSNDQQVQRARKEIQGAPKEKLIAGYIPWVFVWSDRSPERCWPLRPA